MPIPYKEFIKKLASRSIIKQAKLTKSPQLLLFPALEKEKKVIQKQPPLKLNIINLPYAWSKNHISHEITVRNTANAPNTPSLIARLIISEYRGTKQNMLNMMNDVYGDYARHVLEEVIRNNNIVRAYHVEIIDIAPNFRGLGTYKILLKSTTKIARKKTPALVYFDIVPDSPDMLEALMRWYRGLGFHIIDDGRDHYTGWQIFT